jgi:arachidonate 15-lipoxygenase
MTLPQHDRDPARRRGEVAARRKEYHFTTYAELPVGDAFHERDKPGRAWTRDMLAGLVERRANLEAHLERSGRRYVQPLPELPLHERLLALAQKDFTLLFDYYVPDLGALSGGSGPLSLEDYRGVFGKEPLPAVAGVFLEDWAFARSFVAGANPLLLRRIDRPDSDFPVTDDHLRRQRVFDGDSLHRAIGDGRVYGVDYNGLRILRAGQHPHRPKYVHTPRVMLAVPPGGKSLVPVAIQGGPDGRIFTPADGWAWQIAKLAVRAADGTHHEAISHLGLTHLLMEPFVVAMRRCLHESHPIYALLDPHFEGTMPINALAVTKLIQPGKSVDRLVGGEITSVYALIRRERLGCHFHGRMLPNELRSRGVDEGALADYPYRDDARRVWAAIARWVGGYVDHFYADDSVVQKDDELQNWLGEVGASDKGAVSGLADGGRVDGVAALKDVLATVIFTSSAQHAAVNFAQHTDLAFCPAAPMASYGPFPERAEETTEQDFWRMLPPLDVALHTEQILNFLGKLHYGQLGHYGRGQFGDAAIGALERRFQEELDATEAHIDARNREPETRIPYVNLRPSKIPQSINI